jgi:hypothetical protein
MARFSLVEVDGGIDQSVTFLAGRDSLKRAAAAPCGIVRYLNFLILPPGDYLPYYV